MAIEKNHSYARNVRINELIQQEVSDILRRDIKDSVIGLYDLTITEARVSEDLSHAKLFLVLWVTTLKKIGLKLKTL